MSKKVDIKRGSTVVAVGESLEYHGEWMQHGYVTVTVKSAVKIDFQVGDYVEHCGRRYYLWNAESVKKQARSGSYGEAFVYENMKLYEATVAMEQVSMHDYVLGVGGGNGEAYTSLGRFSFYGASVEDLADRIQANLLRQAPAIGSTTLAFRIFTPDYDRCSQRFGATRSEWEAYYTGNEEGGNTDVVVNIQDETTWGALGRVYNDFALPYYVNGLDIVVGGKSESAGGAFAYGKGNGLHSIERNTDQEQRIVTRLFAYGSSENLPLNYYGNMHKLPYADGLSANTFVLESVTFYYVDTLIPMSSVAAAIGWKMGTVPYDTRTQHFHTGLPVSVTLSADSADTPSYASFCIYELNGEQYLSLNVMREISVAITSESKLYLHNGVDINRWPSSKIADVTDYPAGMAIQNLMLPGFPTMSLYDYAMGDGNGTYMASLPNSDTVRAAWRERRQRYTFSTDKASPWIQSAKASVYGIREGEAYFDGSDDHEEVKPTIANTEYCYIIGEGGIADNGWVGEGGTFTIEVRDSGSHFWESVWKTRVSDDMEMAITSGYHNGRSFKATKLTMSTTTGNAVFTCNRIQDESGRWIPNTKQPISNGNTFAAIGIQLPKEYVDAASKKLFELALDELDRIDHGTYTYLPHIDEIYMAKEQAEAIADERVPLHDKIRPGMVMSWTDADLGDVSSIIDSLTIKEDGNNGIPTYDVVLRDEKEKTLVEKISTVVSKSGSIGVGAGQSVSVSGSSGYADRAGRLSGDDAHTAWGQTYWEDGVPQDVDGDMTVHGGISIGETGKGISEDGDATLGDVGADKVTVSESTTTTSGGVETTTENTVVIDADGIDVTEKVNGVVSESTAVDAEGLILGNYAEGLLGTGGVFKMINGKSYLEADKLYVRMKAYFDTLEIRRYYHTNGNRVASNASMKCTRVEWYGTDEREPIAQTDANRANVKSFKCYFRKTDGEDTITNDFLNGDLAFCETTNLKNGNALKRHRYWRRVVQTGSNDTEYYIKLSNEDGKYEADSDFPEPEDVIVQLGSATNEDRQGAIIEATSGAAQAPTYRIYQGINSFNLENKCKVDMGYDLTTHRAYLNVFGNFYVGAEGNNPSTYVRYTQGYTDGNNVTHAPLLEIKAKIDSSSTVGNSVIASQQDVADSIDDATGSLQLYTDTKVAAITPTSLGLKYLADALNNAQQDHTIINGGLLLTSAIALKDGNDVTAGINGKSSVSDIAAWFGGNPFVTGSIPKIVFNFDGSGYLAGGNISWNVGGDTTVQGTIMADNFFHALCYYRERGIYIGEHVLYYYTYDQSHDEGIYGRFVNGHAYTAEEIVELSGGYTVEQLVGFTATTGTADVVMCMPSSEHNWEKEEGRLAFVNLPSPDDFPGKVVEISAYNYGTEARELEVHCYGGDRMTGLVYADGNGDITCSQPTYKATISTGGVARFISARLSHDTYGSYYVWALLANQTGGDVIISGGGGSGGGTVTSVGMTVPQGFNVTGSPITGAGSFTIGFANGYALPTTADVNKGVTAYGWGNHALAGYLTILDAQNTFSLNTHDHDGTYLRLSGDDVMTGNLKLGEGTAVKANDKDTDLLAYKSETWGGVAGEHWFVGAAGVNGFIRSASPLKRWANNSDQYTIWDSSNLNPNSYLLSSAISDWAKAANKPTYNLDEVTDGSTRKLSDYATTSALAALNNATVKLSGNNTMTGQNVFQGITTFQSNVFVSPNNTLYLQSYDSASRPIDSPAASQAWVGQQGYLTSADLSGYATTSELAAKQNKIHFLNTKASGTEVEFSYLHLPLGSIGGGHASLDLSDYATTSALSGYLPLTGGTLTGNLNMNGASVTFGPSGLLAAIYYYSNALHIGSAAVEVISNGVFTFNGDQVATQPWVTSALSDYWNKTSFKGVKVGNTPYSPQTSGTDAGWIDITDEFSSIGNAISGKVSKNGDSMSGNLTMNAGAYLFIKGSNNSTAGSLYAGTLTTVGTTQVNCMNVGGYVNFINTDDAPPFANGKPLATQEWADGRYLKLTGGTMAGPLNMGSNMLSFGTTAAIYYGSGLAGNILVLNADNVDIMTAGGNFRWNSQNVATQTWANGQFVAALGTSGNYLTYTKNGSTTNLTVPFATSTMGFKRLNKEAAGTWDANTMTVEGVQYALLTNYRSTSEWANMPSGMSWGGVLQITAGSGEGVLSGQLAWDSNHNVTTGVTHKLYWRSRNSTGWGTDDWHTIAFQDWVQSWVNNRGFASNQDLYDLGTLVTTGYLPLTAGSSHPLTGNIAYKGTKATYDMITFLDNVGDIYGNGIAIGGGGATIIGGGESAGTMSAQVSGGSEVMYIGNDTSVSIFTNLQSGWANRKEFFFGADGRFWLPQGDSSRQMILHPNGQVQFRAATGRWAFTVGTSNNAGSTSLGQFGSYGEDGSLNYMYIGQSYNDTWMVVKSDGKVGIGTTTPMAKLDVNGNVHISGTLTGVTNIDGLMIFDSTNNKVTVGTLDVTTLGMNSISVGDADYKMSITSDDNGAAFSGSNNGYLFDDDIYAVGGHFTGSMTVGSNSNVTNLTVNGRARFGNYVGIGTEPNTSYALDIDGSARAFSFVNGSDIRMKDIVSYMLPSVHDIASAPIIEFKWKKGDGSKSIGSIAQYWEKVFPQAVHEGGDGMLSMEYGNIALASAITAARHSLDNERRIAELELRVAELEDELAAMVSQHSETTDN